MFNKILLIVCLMHLSSLSFSETIAPNTFTSGGNIVASEMNGNFDVMETGINSNEAMISDLVARVAILESASNSDSTGRSYHLAQIGILNRGDEAYSNITVGNLTQTYTLVLAEDTTFSFVGTESEAEIFSYNGFVDADTAPVDLSGTYVQVGETLTLTFAGGDTVDFKVALDGSVVIFNEFITKHRDSEDVEGTLWFRTSSSLIVGVEIAP